jgi:hypothetical protein
MKLFKSDEAKEFVAGGCVRDDDFLGGEEDAPALKLRPGDQQLPEINEGPIIHLLVIEDLRERLRVGTERYGTGLQAFNGRDALRDAYEEALDLAAYLKQCIVERDSRPDPFKCARCGGPFSDGMSGVVLVGHEFKHYPACPR